MLKQSHGVPGNTSGRNMTQTTQTIRKPLKHVAMLRSHRHALSLRSLPSECQQDKRNCVRRFHNAGLLSLNGQSLGNNYASIVSRMRIDYTLFQPSVGRSALLFRANRSVEIIKTSCARRPLLCSSDLVLHFHSGPHCSQCRPL